MNRIISIAAVLAVLTALPAAAGPELAPAGATLMAPAANKGAVTPSEQAPTVRDTRKPGGHTLRCWQHGRLLYEGSGFRHDLERSASVISVPRSDGDPSTVVMDLKDGMCILSKG